MDQLASADLRDVRVLVVDDNATNRRVFCRMLEGFGCQVSAVASGMDVMPALFRGLLIHSPYSLVLVDMQMPVMDGEETLRAIRREPLTQDVKVVVLTSMGRRNELGRVTELGCSGYLLKPIKQSQLRETLETTLGGKHRQPAGSKHHGARHGQFDLKRKLHILLVEDNEINQKMTRALLTRQGYSVDLAGNGIEAVEAAKKGDYDLIFMDVQMPEMDGFEAAQSIRALEGEQSHTPIVAMTAHALHGDRQRCIDAGMDDYISKPLDPRKVFQAIERWAEAQDNERREGAFEVTGVELESEEVQSVETQTAIKETVLTENGSNLPLNIESALIRFSNDRNFYYNLLEEFLHSLPERLGEMRAALESEDAQSLSNLAHNLKGVAANFSALQIARLSAEIDVSCRSGDLGSARGLMAEAELAAERLNDFVANLTDKSSEVQ